MSTKRHTCCLCGEQFIGWGNNPEPLVPFEDGRCCDDCNWLKVIPTRLGLATGDALGRQLRAEREEGS